MANVREQLAAMGKVVRDEDYTDILLTSLPAYMYCFLISSQQVDEVRVRCGGCIRRPLLLVSALMYSASTSCAL